MSDGVLSIRSNQKAKEARSEWKETVNKKKTGAHRYFLDKRGQVSQKARILIAKITCQTDFVVKGGKWEHVKSYDKYFRSFEYALALDEALKV